VAGKGGVGKTTFSTFLILELARRGGVVLAVDADPNTNLDEKLGVEAGTSVGAIREDLSKSMDSLPAGISKAELVTIKIQQALAEGENFDLLVMGRQEGPGCYCYVNNLLRTIIDNIGQKYSYVIIDNEAGMEHLSRRTTHDVDVLFVLTDATKAGIQTALRIKKLAGEMAVGVEKSVLVVNRADGLSERLNELASKGGFSAMEFLPEEAELGRISEEGRPVSSLSASSPLRKKVEKIASANA
jgi:CO dehydrogenase maturation factor